MGIAKAALLFVLILVARDVYAHPALVLIKAKGTTCTGFLTSANTLMTASHCLPAGFSLSDISLNLSDKKLSATKILEDTKASHDGFKLDPDYAVIMFEPSVTDRTPLKLSTGEVHEGEELTVPTLHDEKKCVAGRDKTKRFLFFDRCEIQAGNSGAPMVTKKGEVAALVRGFVKKENKFYFGIATALKLPDPPTMVSEYK